MIMRLLDSESKQLAFGVRGYGPSKGIMDLTDTKERKLKQNAGRSLVAGCHSRILSRVAQTKFEDIRVGAETMTQTSAHKAQD